MDFGVEIHPVHSGILDSHIAEYKNIHKQVGYTAENSYIHNFFVEWSLFKQNKTGVLLLKRLLKINLEQLFGCNELTKNINNFLFIHFFLTNERVMIKQLQVKTYTFQGKTHILFTFVLQIELTSNAVTCILLIEQISKPTGL